MPDKNLRAVIQLVKTNKRSLTRPAVPLGEEHGLISRTAAGNRAYIDRYSTNVLTYTRSSIDRYIN